MLHSPLALPLIADLTQSLGLSRGEIEVKFYQHSMNPPGKPASGAEHDAVSGSSLHGVGPAVHVDSNDNVLREVLAGIVGFASWV